MANTKVAAVTLIGQKHKNRDVPCEDSSLATIANGVSVVVVSDGAGGKEYTHARFGSKITCETIADLLTNHFDAIYNENREAAIKNILIAAIHANMADAIVEMNLDSLERLSCTMLFCAVKDRRVICGHIGDGLMVRVSSSGVSPITMPQNGQNASSTYFITANHAADYMRLIKTTIDDIHGIALMTDGVQDMVYDENSGLVKPVIAKMVDTLKGTREECESQIGSILEKYVVGASNMSDDASFGILMFDETSSPDASKLLSSTEAFPRNFDDSFKNLQTELLPKVKKAKNVIMNAGSNVSLVQKSENSEDEKVPEGETDVNKVATSSNSVLGKAENTEVGKDISVSGKKEDRFVLGIIIGALCSAALLSIVYWIIPLFMH